MQSRHFAALGLLGALVLGCNGGGSGSTGHAGTTGSSGGSGTTGSAAGTTGNTAGTTGDAAGTTGSEGGTTGSAAGTTGNAAGATGSAAGATGSTAGAIGSAAGATGGNAGATGTADAGAVGRASGPSAGCMKDVPAEPIGSCLMHDIDITGMAQPYVAGYTHRTYGTTIPKNYQATTPYPVVMYGPGCGGESCEGGPFTGRSDVFIIQATKAPDVYNGKVPPVPPAAAPGCFQTGVISTVDSPELQYFDQVLAEVESKYCIDKARVFVAGSSSGAWFANFLACARGNVIRGSAADSGGIPVDRPACTGGAGVIEFPGDSAMKKDSMGREIGAALARDLFVKTNGCSMTATSMKVGTATCDVYGGCSSPVAWCNVGGSHQSGLGSISPVGWPFWSMLQ